MSPNVDQILKSVVTTDGELAELIESVDPQNGQRNGDEVSLTIFDQSGTKIIDHLALGTVNSREDPENYDPHNYDLQVSGDAIGAFAGADGDSQAYFFYNGKMTASISGTNDFGGAGSLQVGQGFSYSYDSQSDSYVGIGNVRFEASLDENGSVTSFSDLNRADAITTIPENGVIFDSSTSGLTLSYNYTGSGPILSQSSYYYYDNYGYFVQSTTNYSNGNIESTPLYYDGYNEVLVNQSYDYLSGYKLVISDASSGQLDFIYYYNSSNLLTKVESFGKDGQKTVSNFEPLTKILTEGESYNAAGQIVDVNVYNDQGQRISGTHRSYDSTGHLVQRAGTSYDATSGRVLQSRTVNADGSSVEVSNAVTGKPYTEQVIAYVSAGKVASTTRYYGDAAHTLALSQVVNADGSFVVHSYDTVGREGARTLAAADGSREIMNFTYAGSATTPNTVQDLRYAADGKLLTVDTTNADASHTQLAKRAGAILTSTGAVDRFTGAGSDTFVFKPAFGQDIVTNFQAGAGSTHDTLDLAALHLASNPGESSLDVLGQALRQTGHDMILTITPTDTITLKNTVVASLVKEDFRLA